jgi:glycosyltransferase involved in cell wall biosynthesis
MRVMMLAQFYPPLIGGEERFVRDLSVQLAARGHEVSVVTLWQDGLKRFEIDEDVRVYRISGTIHRLTSLGNPEARRHAAPLPDPELTNNLRRIISAEKPEIVHGHNWMAHAFLPLKHWSQARFVMSVHDYSVICAKKKLIYQDALCSGPGLAKCFACATDHYGLKGIPTVVGNWVMNAVERAEVDIFLPVSKAVAELNAIVSQKLPYRILTPFVPDDITELGEAPDEFLEKLPREPFLLFIGAFGRYKGVDVLLEAHARMKNPPPLVIIGYQTSEHPVRTTYLADNVTVILDAPRQSVLAACQRSLAGVFPSTWAEPFGIVALEAMACGRPVVASRIGGLQDIVQHEVTGLLVTPGDVDLLQEALERLNENPQMAQRMGEAGKSRVHEFLASTVTPHYERVYDELLERDGTPEPADLRMPV